MRIHDASGATRRRFLVTGGLGTAAILLGCRPARPETRLDAGVQSVPPDAGGIPLDAGARTCALTEDNIEGPFFKPGAPRRSVLAGYGSRGTRLHLGGRVLSASCGPLAGALLEVWHADHQGAYDNVGFGFRGTLVTDSEGRFELESIVPGRYLNGRQYRPAHVHVKLAARGHRPLTTQLYFEGDPYNAVDPFVRRSLVVPVSRNYEGGVDLQYDFVLAPA